MIRRTIFAAMLLNTHLNMGKKKITYEVLGVWKSYSHGIYHSSNSLKIVIDLDYTITQIKTNNLFQHSTAP